MTIEKPCEYCGMTIPDFELTEKALESIVSRIIDSGPTLCRAEIRHWSNCSDEASTRYLEHALQCASWWPFSPEDRELLRRVDEAFGGIEKPGRFVNSSCPESADHEETLSSYTKQSLPRSEAGHAGWNPFHFSSVHDAAYYFPTLARFSLRPRFDQLGDDYSDSLVFLLSIDCRWVESFTHFQNLAVKDLLIRLHETKGSDYISASEMNQALVNVNTALLSG